MMADYTLVEATTRTELDAIVDLAWTAYHEPYNPSFQAYHPVFGPTPADLESAMRNDKERAWTTHTATASSHWIYVRDAHTDAIVGSAQWLVFKDTPWPDELPELEATWWPEGSEGREFVSQMMRQVYAPRMQWCNRPHVGLNQTSVHPDHRRKGVGSLLMRWGVGKADELRLESFIEATDSGRFLYETFGYRALMKLSFSPEKKHPSREWTRLAFEMSPFHMYPMWRPAGGVFEEGRPQTPWQVDQARARAGVTVRTPAMYLSSD